MKAPVDTSLTLEQIEGSWGDLETAPTDLVKRCILASKVPLRDLTSEHLRLLIGQQFSLEYLLPMALPLLEAYPLLEGDLYEGDVLQNVLTLDWHDTKIQQYLPRVVAMAKAAHLQMMREATEDLLQGNTPEGLGLSEHAHEQIKRRAVQNISIAPWDALVNFLEIHG
jgi:hypothetical protein